ncbi:uncharacterized protein GGS25DRAFT_470240 [Hypoxylon fragiforme]|uniref:uncharacterized protein n=1 Tax=Hypoxylon fragiforme TaxID=63214 RepID=UPI0020C70DBD|nr:uncharacterized protein GGS25DRAFT_470240 [Hypoxylon fragiforme]KAI2614073.1 hypothetical protein GGS25DRAFT_470240 [Hypoxylon fragiforme]
MINAPFYLLLLLLLRDLGPILVIVPNLGMIICFFTVPLHPHLTNTQTNKVPHIAAQLRAMQVGRVTDVFNVFSLPFFLSRYPTILLACLGIVQYIPGCACVCTAVTHHPRGLHASCSTYCT